MIEKEEISQPIITEINSPISDPILNHLRMKTTGALLLTGDWGSGKTYHIKKFIFPLIEAVTDFTPLIVSLYGETEKNNIAQKVLFAYLDSKGTKVNLGTGTIAKNIKNISEAIPYIKKFVNIEKVIFGSSDNIFKLIPHDKLFICFDDIERMSEEVNINDFLGLINDLVENKGCKVLLIANESEIKNGIAYKEKTIEKTIHFSPNISDVFDSVVGDYPEGAFKEFLIKNKSFFIKSLTIEEEVLDLNKDLKKSFSNIRTLKFSIEHFKVAFELIIEDKTINELFISQLKNLWLFTLSISIEFRKPNNISLIDKKDLDSQTSSFSDIDFGNFEFLTDNNKIDGNKIEKEVSYVDNFKEKYYTRLSETYIYYEELYNLITSGKQINKNIFIKTLDENFKIKEGKINPAHQILNSFMHQGYWSYTNEDFNATANKLLDYCEKGILQDITSYLNAGVYLLGFNELIGVDKDLITSKIRTGIDLFLATSNFTNFHKSQFEMIQGSFTGSHLISLIEHIKEKIKEIENLKNIKFIKSLQALFESDLSLFVKEFLPGKSSIRSINEPLFHQIELESIKLGVLNAKPEEIMDLTSLLKIRYLDYSYNESLKDELSFINKLSDTISEIDLSIKNLSNHLIETQLIPRINEVKIQLQK